jgi:hypothetical protein
LDGIAERDDFFRLDRYGGTAFPRGLSKRLGFTYRFFNPAVSSGSVCVRLGVEFVRMRDSALAPNNGQQTSFKNCATQKLKPQLNSNLNTWLGQLQQAPLFGVVGAAGVTGALVIAEPETLPVAPAVFGVLAVNLIVYAANVSTTYAAGKSILQIGAAAITCGVQTF